MASHQSESSGTNDDHSAHTPNKRSKVWEYFEQELVDVDGVMKAVCKYCASKLTTRRKSDEAVHVLPGRFADEHGALGISDDRYNSAIVFGRVPSTGERKVLRVLDRLNSCLEQQWCEVCTLGGCSCSSCYRWRGKDHPTDSVEVQSSVVVDGILYFFTHAGFLASIDAAVTKRIASFDLGAEEWRAALHGPQINLLGDGAVGMFNDDQLVAQCSASSVDLWFLTDFDKGLWVKQHSINTNDLSVQPPAS